MAKHAFGKTWWGEQWLNALHAVDWDNRLPRGRRYANNGSVRSLDIQGGRVEARVAGSRRTPYKVALEIPALPRAKRDRLLDAIAANPALIARLLNRELDPAMLEQAEQAGVRIFPRDWQDLHMRCSCPDWASPCKHVAAVIYLVSREIDADPFQVFALRGLDLIDELRRRGLDIDDQTRGGLAALVDILPGDATAGGAGDARADAPDLPGGVDYSGLPRLLESLMQALPSDPGFASASVVRKAWQTQLRRAMRHAAKALEASGGDIADPGGDGTQRLAWDADPVVTVDKECELTLSGASQAADLNELLSWLAELGPDAHAGYKARVAAWQTARTAALHLIAAGAVVPRLFAVQGGGAGCLWLPAMLDPHVQAVMRAVADRLPEGLLRMREGRRRRHLSPMAHASLACGLVVDDALRDWAELPASQADDKLVSLLFGEGYAYFTAPGEHGLGERFNLWLARLQLTERRYAPVLSLAEGDDGHGFRLEIAVEDRQGEASAQPVALAEALADEAWATARSEVLQTIAVLAESYPALHDYVRGGADEALVVTGEQLPELLFEVLPFMRTLGIRVLLPKALERTLRPKASVAVHDNSDSDSASGLLQADDLFRFDWRVAVGDELLTKDEFEALVAKAQGIVRFRGQYVYLEPTEIERLQRQLDQPPDLSGAELTRVALAGEYEGAPITLDAGAREQIRRHTQVDDVAMPPGLAAELRPYQARGVAWLYRNARAGLGSILADDMGLGKTLQVIATIARLQADGELDEGRALIVVPTTLLTNWQREIEHFAPSLSLAVYHGPERRLETEQRPDVLLTTYGMARREAAKLKRQNWRLLVVDEAQNVKNPSAAQTRAIKSIPARAAIAMSGTPVENRLVEYWSIMDLVNRGYLGSRKHFESNYGKPIQVHGDEQVAERFRRVTAPFLMRREKSDKTIISDLPEKIVQDQFCELTAEQSALYESVVREGMAVIEGESDTFQRQGLILQMIMALKQIGNHPAQYSQDAAPALEASGKALRLLELIEAAQRQQEKALVFTQFQEMGHILTRWVQERFGREPGFLHGGVARKQRDALVKDFQENPASRVLILSLKAGGTGLNLTAASQVIHYDLWWNPAVEDQATDRAYRIGQTRGVQVHRLITRHTFEERINDMIRSKRGLAGMTVASGEQWIGQLGDDELRELFEPQRTEDAR